MPTDTIQFPATETPLPTDTSTPSFTPTLTFTPEPTGYPAQIRDPYDVPMVLVPEGTFQMGLEADTAYQECQQLYIGGTCDLIFFTNMEPVLQVYLDTF